MFHSHHEVQAQDFDILIKPEYSYLSPSLCLKDPLLSSLNRFGEEIQSQEIKKNRVAGNQLLKAFSELEKRNSYEASDLLIRTLLTTSDLGVRHRSYLTQFRKHLFEKHLIDNFERIFENILNPDFLQSEDTFLPPTVGLYEEITDSLYHLTLENKNLPSHQLATRLLLCYFINGSEDDPRTKTHQRKRAWTFLQLLKNKRPDVLRADARVTALFKDQSTPSARLIRDMLNDSVKTSLPEWALARAILMGNGKAVSELKTLAPHINLLLSQTLIDLRTGRISYLQAGKILEFLRREEKDNSDKMILKSGLKDFISSRKYSALEQVDLSTIQLLVEYGAQLGTETLLELIPSSNLQLRNWNQIELLPWRELKESEYFGKMVHNLNWVAQVFPIQFTATFKDLARRNQPETALFLRVLTDGEIIQKDPNIIPLKTLSPKAWEFFESLLNEDDKDLASYVYKTLRFSPELLRQIQIKLLDQTYKEEDESKINPRLQAYKKPAFQMLYYLNQEVLGSTSNEEVQPQLHRPIPLTT